mmetsp:Transcript_96351/g.274597  ORF Transcript_96351/g.274597 Transcript_96351/m.274597 type:complete len:360 (-) Transcript_96351:90-1169(-)
MSFCRQRPGSSFSFSSPAKCKNLVCFLAHGTRPGHAAHIRGVGRVEHVQRGFATITAAMMARGGHSERAAKMAVEVEHHDARLRHLTNPTNPCTYAGRICGPREELGRSLEGPLGGSKRLDDKHGVALVVTRNVRLVACFRSAKARLLHHPLTLFVSGAVVLRVLVEPKEAHLPSHLLRFGPQVVRNLVVCDPSPHVRLPRRFGELVSVGLDVPTAAFLHEAHGAVDFNSHAVHVTKFRLELGQLEAAGGSVSIPTAPTTAIWLRKSPRQDDGVRERHVPADGLGRVVDLDEHLPRVAELVEQVHLVNHATALVSTFFERRVELLGCRELRIVRDGRRDRRGNHLLFGHGGHPEPSTLL